VDNIQKGANPAGSIFLLMVPIVILLVLPRALRKAARNAITSNKLLQKTQNYNLTEDGFAITSENGNGFVRWCEFYKANETKENFLFYISKQQAYLIPKRCLSMADSEIAFIRMCLSKVPKPKPEKTGIKKVLRFGFLFYILLFIFILIVLVALSL
jgi:hypothetical protein